MNQIYKKTILNTIIPVLGIGLLFFAPTFVGAQNLIDVQFEQEPLFQETNFLPGQGVNHWVKVTNTSSGIQAIGVEVINHSSCSENCLADQLKLTITTGGGNELYEDFLSNFFGVGAVKLSDLGEGEIETYYFSVVFLTEAGNVYQNSVVNFDFDIGAFGEETIGGEVPSGGPRGGGSILMIFNENTMETGLTRAMINWLTNKPATSRVIYSSENEPHSLELSNPPNYGYTHSTVENPILETEHSMFITGLDPGTTYYYRCVSHGSFALSGEHSFTTSRHTGEEGGESYSSGGGTGEEGGEMPGAEEVPVAEPIVEDIVKEASEDQKTGINRLLAGIGAIFNAENLCLIFSLFIIVLAVLFLLSNQRKREVGENKKKRWILLSTIIVLIIIYFFLCPYWWILTLITAVLILSSFFLRK